MTDPETPDEAYERLLRETRLSEQIRWLEAGLGRLQLCVLSTPEVMLLIDQLRELRARRIAMGREPDDEVNAPADMCSCVVGHSGKRWPPVLWGTEKAPFRDGCPMHPRPELARRDHRLPVTAPQIQAGIAAGTLVCQDSGLVPDERNAEADLSCPGCGAIDCICGPDE